MDLNNLSFKEIVNFLPQISTVRYGVACRAVAKNRGTIVLVTFVIDNVFSLAYHEQNTEPDNYLLNEILPRCKFFR